MLLAIVILLVLLNALGAAILLLTATDVEKGKRLVPYGLVALSLINLAAFLFMFAHHTAHPWDF